jgi:hypothetical protein
VALDLEPSEAGPLILLGWGAMPGMLWGVDVEALTPTWTDVGSILGPDGECSDVPALAGCLVNLGAVYPIAPQLQPPVRRGVPVSGSKVPPGLVAAVSGVSARPSQRSSSPGPRRACMTSSSPPKGPRPERSCRHPNRPEHRDGVRDGGL